MHVVDPSALHAYSRFHALKHRGQLVGCNTKSSRGCFVAAALHSGRQRACALCVLPWYLRLLPAQLNGGMWQDVC